MRKVKIDKIDLKIVINGMYLMRKTYLAERMDQVDTVNLYLIDICEAMKPNRKKKIKLDSSQPSFFT